MKMFTPSAAFLLAVACKSATALQVVRDGADPEADVRPVTRVVQLLTDMKVQLEKEADADEVTYQNLATWCTTNDRDKTKAIANGEDRVTQLSAEIEKNIQLGEKLKVEISALEKELAEGREALAQAEALRTTQKEEFLGEEKEMVESIRALDAAVTVLGRHQTGTALVAAKQVATEASKTLARIHAQRYGGSMLQLGGGPTFKAPYEPQSSEIFGVLTEMKKTFEADLSASQKEEINDQSTFSELTQAKEAEIKSGQVSLEDKQQQLAKSVDELAKGREDRSDTEAALAADKDFLSQLKVKCALTDHEWEQRQKTRQDEIAAVTEVIGLLSSDDARELFGRVLEKAPALLQVANAKTHARGGVVERLEKLAAQQHDARLSKLVAVAKLADFTRVKQAIDELVADLKAEGEEDVLRRDGCNNQIGESDRLLAKEDHTKGKLSSKLDGLHDTQKSVQQNIKDLEAEVAELKGQLQTASQNRESERLQFNTTLADQKAAQQLLEQALHTLELRYKAAPLAGVAMVALGHKTKGVQAPPADFKEYEKSGHAPSILSLLQHIIEDAVNLQEEAKKAESEAQDTYMQFKQSTSESVFAKKNSIVNRQSELAQVDGAIAQTDTELGESVAELGSLTEGRTDLEAGCDFILKNFQARSEARAQEVEALGQAKAYLSGMQ